MGGGNVTASSLGLIAGLLLGIAAAIGGFGGFLVALVLGAVGYAIAGHVAGEIDLTQLTRARER
jgi:nitrate/nitrite transporter NarK